MGPSYLGAHVGQAIFSRAESLTPEYGTLMWGPQIRTIYLIHMFATCVPVRLPMFFQIYSRLWQVPVPRNKQLSGLFGHLPGQGT